MTECNMQLPFQCQCYDCGGDRAEKCIDKINCEHLNAFSSKSIFASKKSTFIVMLQKWLCNFKLDKLAGNKNIGLNASQIKQQVQTRIVQGTNLNSFLIERHSKNPIQMEQTAIIQSKLTIDANRYRMDGEAFWTQTIQNTTNQFPISMERNCEFANKNATICPKHSVKTHQNDLNGVAEHIMHKQRYNLSSTKLATVSQTIGNADHGMNDGGVDSNQQQQQQQQQFHNQSNDKQQNANQLMAKTCAKPSTATKSTLKIVHRSPLTAIHRTNLLQIFIKYLLILNCFMCIANGNLMSRNIGNDLSSKHNQTTVETATTPLNSSRKGGPTTPSPLILHSIMSNNNRSQFMSPSLQSQESERAKQFLQQHAQEALTSGFLNDEPASSYKLPNADDSTEEFSRCAQCQFREQLKAQNLASIKMHILARLSMTHPPNITGRPHISEQILQTFYQNNDFRYIRVRNGTNDDMNEMQGDDPNASSGQHQHHHLHEYHRNGGIKTGLHEQHHHHQSSYHHHNRHTRLDNEYNEEYDYSDRGGIVYNMDYYDEPRSSTRLHYDDVPPYDNVEETDEAFYSTTDSIYSFPKLSKARHRGDILEFTIKNNNHLSVSGATFNLYVRGEDWIQENEPNIWMRTGSGNAGRTNTGGIHIDDSATGSSPVSATAARDDHNFAAPSDSFHKLHGNGKNVNNNHISISINRFVHRHQQQQSTNDQEQSKKSAQPTQQQQQQQQQQRYTRIDSNFVGEIPKGAGEWIQFNITLMVSEWIQQQQQKHQSVNTQSADIVQEVVIKTLEPTWMRQLLVLDTNSKNRPYIEIQTRDMRKHRTKRHLAKDCRENDRQSRCCRYPLRVDFRKFGWDWIIAPDIYEAYYCAGECPIGFLPKHPHTYIYSLSSSFSTCCSPRKLSPLSLLYFDDNKNVIHSIIPNMAVEKCGCS